MIWARTTDSPTRFTRIWISLSEYIRKKFHVIENNARFLERVMIFRICTALKCDTSDIMEMVPEEATAETAD
jgi:DNA-binding Xre family transcriptional regulator